MPSQHAKTEASTNLGQADHRTMPASDKDMAQMTQTIFPSDSGCSTILPAGLAMWYAASSKMHQSLGWDAGWWEFMSDYFNVWAQFESQVHGSHGISVTCWPLYMASELSIWHLYTYLSAHSDHFTLFSPLLKGHWWLISPTDACAGASVLWLKPPPLGWRVGPQNSWCCLGPEN